MSSRLPRGRPENVLRKSQFNLPGTSIGSQIRTSPGRHFKTSPGPQIGTSPESSNRIYKERPGDVGGERSWDAWGSIFARSVEV